ncbi:MAG: dynamin family protein [Actinomycetota bacterium]
MTQAGSESGRGDAVGVVGHIEELCDLATRLTVGTQLAERVDEISERLRGPLRVAIAGRLKAGKSTLLNALVGERLAATDAGECTRIVTLYRHATGYDVAARLHDGTDAPLRFRRDDEVLHVDLGGLHLGDIDHLDVRWPARVLAELTLIDTPGLESLNDENSRRTQTFLEHDGSDPANADAVVYLMRHLHRSDADFLGSFLDRSVAGSSPVNAIAVLSRADEIGACRPDAMQSAARIARRYARDPVVRSLVGDVVPVAGLLAETGLTLREHEYAALVQLADMAAGDRERLLLSVDDVCDVGLSPLTAEIRRDLLDRFGLFGLRHSVAAIAAGEVGSAGELSRALVEASGVGALQRVISETFLPRARVLQARTALAALRTVGRELSAAGHPDAPSFAAVIDRIDASALEFGLLQAGHLVLSGAVALGDAHRHDVERLLAADDPVRALGLDDLAPEQREAELLAGLARWRETTNDPLSGPLDTAVADTMVRVYDRLYTDGQAS